MKAADRNQKGTWLAKYIIAQIRALPATQRTCISQEDSEYSKYQDKGLVDHA